MCTCERWIHGCLTDEYSPDKCVTMYMTTVIMRRILLYITHVTGWTERFNFPAFVLSMTVAWRSPLTYVHLDVYVCACAGAYQVLVGEPGDLVLQAGFDASLRRQLQVLGQQLLLPVVFLLDVLQLAAQPLRLVVIATPLRLQLALQQPATEGRESGRRR